MRTSATRLYVLGLLHRHGPLHGHALRQLAHKEHVDLWTEIRPGSLYASLRQLEGEGLLVVERVERPGRLPPRTVYGVTVAGRREFRRLLRSVLADAGLRPDPVDLAVAMSADLPHARLVALLSERQRQLAREAESWARLREKAWPFLSAAERLVFSHSESRFRAELGWHQALLVGLSVPAADAGPGEPAAVRAP